MQAAIVSSAKYFIIALLFIVSGFLFLIQPVHAQSECEYDQSLTDKEIIDQVNRCIIENDNYDDKASSKNQFFGLIDAVNTSILGISQLNPEISGITANRSALASVSTMIAGLYANPPSSGKEYFAQQIQKFNPVQPAYAQTGTGYDSLKPVQQLWTVFRNASYVGFVIVFVIIGFMIMFRAHISPQAVATVQDSLPRIVIALVLVTLSYAIAGFMIDIMFLAINIFIQLLDQSGVIKGDVASSKIFDRSIIGVIIGAWDDIFGTTASAIKDLLDSVITGGGLLSLLKTTLGGGIAGLIVGIAALFIIFRVLLMLLMAYVMIILLTLIAPFFFLIQSLPGNNGAREWFKQMTSNIAVFPAVALMILLAGAIGGIEAFGGTQAGTLKDVGGEALKFPLLVGGLDSSAIGKIIALGFLLMTPAAAQMVKESIGAKGGPPLGVAGAILGGAAGLAAKPVQYAARPYLEAREFRRREQAYEKMYGQRMPKTISGGTEPGVGSEH